MPEVRRREAAPKQSIKLPASKICERYNVVDRTLDRWLKNPKLNFPRPLYINKRRYFDLSAVEKWERAQAAGTAA
jgi:hypothetical protein